MTQRTWWVGVGVGIGLLATAWVTIPTVRAEPLATVDGEPVHVEADRLEVDLQSGRATLVGNVRMRRGKLQVACGKLEAKYDHAPSIRWAKATEGVRAQLDEFDARSAEAELHMDRSLLRLRGDVSIRRGGAWMQARDVSVDLKTHRMTLEQVRGSIPVASGLPTALPATLPATLPTALPTAQPSDRPRAFPASSGAGSDPVGAR